MKKNITREVKRGEGQRREVVRARRKLDREEMEEVDMTEVDMEAQVKHSYCIVLVAANNEKMLGFSSGHVPKRLHTLSTILPEMEQACVDLEAEIASLEADTKSILDDLQATVGDLSDLRYGKFGQLVEGENDMRTDVLEGLQGLEQACRNAMRNKVNNVDHHTG